MISKAQHMENNMFILPGDLNAYFNEFKVLLPRTIENIEKSQNI